MTRLGPANKSTTAHRTVARPAAIRTGPRSRITPASIDNHVSRGSQGVRNNEKSFSSYAERLCDRDSRTREKADDQHRSPWSGPVEMRQDLVAEHVRS